MTDDGLGPRLPRPRARQLRGDQGGLEPHARAALRPDRHDRVGGRHLRELRPGELRDGQARARRLREHARGRGPQAQRLRQHHRADRWLAAHRDGAPAGARRRARPGLRLAARRVALPRGAARRPAGSSRSAAATSASSAGSAPRASSTASGRADLARDTCAARGRRSPTSRQERAPRLHHRVDAARSCRTSSAARARAATSTSTSTRPIGYVFPEMKSSYDERDLALYALGVGAGEEPATTRRTFRSFTRCTDSGFKAVPTYGVIQAHEGA